MLRQIARSLFLLAAALATFPAFAQSTPYQGGPWTPGHLPQYTGVGSSHAVIMDGGGSGGGGLGVNPNEIGVTSFSPTGSYPVANGGNGPNGEHGCFYDAPTTNASGYHYLCLDPNAIGGGLITYGAGGAASALPLQFSINGVVTNIQSTTVPFGVNVGGTGATTASAARTNLGLGALATASTINLATQTTGNLSTGNLASGSGASSSTFWRGDGNWAIPTASAGGSNGQLQFNNSGLLGGFTVGGDATLNSSTGVLTVTKTNGTAFGTFATNNYAAPPAIGGATPAAGSFTALSASTSLTVPSSLGAGCLYTSGSGAITATTCGGGGGGSTALTGAALTISGTNIISTTISSAYTTGSSGLATMYVNGVSYTDHDASPAFSVSAGTITWSAANAGFSITTADKASIAYSTGASGLVIGASVITGGTANDCLTVDATGTKLAQVACGSGSGTVTSVSIVSANGFAGSVATSTTTPAITLSTSITGLLKGNGTAISAATAGTDYLAPSGSGAALTGITWSQIGSTPTTLVGYGITNGATNGANSNITSLTGLTTPLSVAQGGSGSTSPAIVAGTNITVSGSWPNQTINATGSGSGTVNSGTTGQVAYYASSTAAVSGESLSALIDSAIGSTQGTILYRGVSAWAPLTPGTNGYFLQTQGPSANPTWAAASGGSGCTTGGSSGNPLVANGSGGCSTITTDSLVNGALTLGSSGVAGSVAMGNATSGTVTLAPVTGALGVVTASLPANTGVIAELNLAQTFSAAQTFSTSVTVGVGSAVTSSGPGGALASGAFAAAYSLPTATSSVLGGVKPDGTTIANSSGAISLGLSNANTWVGIQSFTDGDLALKGSTSGSMILHAPAVASAYAMTFPAATDTVAVLGLADQTLAGGANLTVTALTTGSITVDCGKGPGQYIANTGAFTITAPSNDGECILQIENGSGAGAVTWSGFSEGANTGDALTTTSGNAFQVSITRIHSKSHYLITALQ